MKMRHSALSALLLAGLLLALLANGQPASPAKAAAGLFKIIFIDVGQGDSALLIDPDGFAVLIDGGKAAAGPAVTAMIRSQGLADIDVMVATHPDEDHIGGLIAVLQMDDVPVKAVLYNGYPGTTDAWYNFMAAVQAEEGLKLLTVTYPQALTWNAISAQALNPAAGLTTPGTNEACLALLVQTGSIKTLFACDLDTGQESVVLDRFDDIDADLLKVAHHGSDTSSSAAFLAAVTPREAIISVRKDDLYHPGQAAIARLEDAGARIWRTDLQGHITVVTDGSTYAVTQELPVAGPAEQLFLPVVIRVDAPAPTPDPTEPPPAGSIVITSIFYDGVLGSSEPDEYVELHNSGGAVQLQGWTLSDNQDHIYTFPSFVIQTGQTCRVYTNQSNPDSCGFNYASSSAIWNNTGDCAILKDAQGQEISRQCY